MRKFMLIFAACGSLFALGGCGYRSYSAQYDVAYGSYDCDPGYYYESHHYSHHGHRRHHGHHGGHRRGHY